MIQFKIDWLTPNETWNSSFKSFILEKTWLNELFVIFWNGKFRKKNQFNWESGKWMIKILYFVETIQTSDIHTYIHTNKQKQLKMSFESIMIVVINDNNHYWDNETVNNKFHHHHEMKTFRSTIVKWIIFIWNLMIIFKWLDEFNEWMKWWNNNDDGGGYNHHLLIVKTFSLIMNTCIMINK